VFTGCYKLEKNTLFVSACFYWLRERSFGPANGLCWLIAEEDPFYLVGKNRIYYLFISPLNS